MLAGARPDLAWQGSLFAQGRPSPDDSFRTAERVALDERSWVDVAPGWLAGSEALFADLVGRLRWTAREMPMYGQVVAQPRLSAWWSLTDERVREPLVAHLGDALGRRYGVTFTSVGANLYRTGSDSVAWHADRHARAPGDPDVVIPVLSLGSPRRFVLRPRAGGPSVGLDVAGGDLVVMGGACQREWQHAVPKQAHAGPRLSLSYRYDVR